MPKTSGFLAQIEQEKIKAMRIARHLELVFCCDILCITLGRMGYGEKRLKDVEQMFSAVYDEYDKLREKDGKKDKDNWYYQGKLDEELQKYTGKWFEPYERRYY